MDASAAVLTGIAVFSGGMLIWLAENFSMMRRQQFLHATMQHVVFNGVHVAVSGMLGALPEARRAEALERLMEMNLIFFRGNSPVFARDPVNGTILFCSEILFAAVTPEAVLESLRHIAAQAQLWRRGRFLDEPPEPFRERA